jgi:type IV pilus assembly protein PilC
LRYYFKTENGNYVKATFLLKVPLFGPLFIKAAMSRFAAIFAILQASGVPVMDAMNILSGTIGNAAISRQFEKVRELLKEGQGISAPLRATKYFTPMTIDMVAVGEESGNIDDMLREVTLHYDDEVSYAVKRLSDAIGPILMVGLAAVVGFFALAIFLPMWDLTKMAK